MDVATAQKRRSALTTCPRGRLLDDQKFGHKALDQQVCPCIRGRWPQFLS